MEIGQLIHPERFALGEAMSCMEVKKPSIIFHKDHKIIKKTTDHGSKDG